MRTALLLALLGAYGCAGRLYSYDGPDWHTWAGKGALAASSAVVCEKLFSTPWPCAGLVCGFMLGHEWEETRAFTVVEKKGDTAMDMLSPCGLGLSVSLVLR